MFSLKKTLSVIVVLAMVLSSVAVFAFSASAASENVALNKNYTISGCGNGYGVYTAKLTDGNANDVIGYDDTWFAFYNNEGADASIVNAPNYVGYAIIDLEETYGIEKVSVNAIDLEGDSGIKKCGGARVYLSADNENWSEATELSIPESTTKGVAYAIEGAVAGNARYVKVEFDVDGVFVFINEINVYGGAASADEPSEEESEEEPVAPVEKPFWVTHVNDNTVEGSGVIFTEAYTGAAWWIHVAFAPVAGEEGVFEIVAISDGIAEGSGVAQDIPEGGFVWASNVGNNYPELNPDDATAIDYTSANCSNAIADAQTWSVGDKFAFNGIDPLNPEIATSTPDVKWYDDAYVCTSTYLAYTANVEEEESEEAPAVSEEESVEVSEEETEPGDASSMIVFAIIALVALAGSAVIVKNRK